MALNLDPYQQYSAQPYFTYGSLMDGEVFTTVAGVALDDAKARLGWVSGQIRQKFASQSYPILNQASDAMTFGLVLPPLTADALARIHCYESEDYRIDGVQVSTANGLQDCITFVPTGRAEPGHEPWALKAWQADAKPMVLAVVGQVMAEIDAYDMQSADLRFNELEAIWNSSQNP